MNDVALRLQQGEIVGLLGPNGAGKTTTFYMIVGLIQPLAGRIVLDGADITSMPMYQRARQGIGYLSQEPSIFRKLSVEENILAILETLPISPGGAARRLEKLLDELSIKHLRHSKAYSLSGGERRRLEITRALVTQPKFMMLDEPFAGVDPIAVHDIQTDRRRPAARGIGVLISDHNVEQTLDIVDRAYIMFDGQVKVSGTVRELVFDETVADIYLGPTLTARLRARFADASTGDSRMRPGLSQSTQLKQELKINPRLYQAMDLLYMPLLDLQQHLKQELLEQSVPRDGRAGGGRGGRGRGRTETVEVREPRAGEGRRTTRSTGRRSSSTASTPAAAARSTRSASTTSPSRSRRATSSDHLRDQITLLDLTPRQMFLADEFIGNIDEDGYLACSLEEILERRQRDASEARPRSRSATIDELPLYTMDEAEEMLAIIQSLDPPGVGARDLRECLCSSSREAGLEQSVPYRLVRDCFDELINHRWSEISKRFGISPTDVQKAADEIAKLDPKPGLDVQRRERQLHHPRPHRRQDRRQVPRLPERRQPAAPEAEHAPTRRSRATRRSSRARTRSSSPTS